MTFEWTLKSIRRIERPAHLKDHHNHRLSDTWSHFIWVNVCRNQRKEANGKRFHAHHSQMARVLMMPSRSSFDTYRRASFILHFFFYVSFFFFGGGRVLYSKKEILMDTPLVGHFNSNKNGRNI